MFVSCSSNDRFKPSINSPLKLKWVISEEDVTSTHYFVRVRNQEFNYSNNPTFTSGSNGTFRFSTMKDDPRVYITTVGLYDDSNQLLAVAKLSKPQLKSFAKELLVKVKLDY